MKHLLSSLLGAASLVLGGCLYTSHHFNSGRILEPGNTAVTLGYGSFKMRDLGCDEGQGYSAYADTSGVERCLRPDFSGSGAGMDTADPVLSVLKIPRFSLGYRLGVRGAWGPFTGVELGWHLEVPTNPGTAEFDLKLGLPAPPAFRLFHSVSGGWGVGMWADNSFFGEYAASRAFGRGGGGDAHALYANYRLTRLATQPGEVFGTDSLAGRFLHKRRWAQQAGLGFHCRLPDLVILPDFVSPQVTVSTPWVPGLDDAPPEESFLLDVNFGFGWRF